MSFINPYDILGVKETDSIRHIESVYRQYVKMLHPDKSNSIESRNLNMTREEKIEYFNLIKNAYNTIRQNHKDKNNDKYPDYNIDYNINSDFTINVNDFTKDDIVNLDNNKFNRIFLQNKNRDTESGISDPFEKGYDIFNEGKNFNQTGNITSIPTYSSEISTSMSKNVEKPDILNGNKLIEHIPSSSMFSETSMPYQELGLSNISDFSVVIPGKCGLQCSDLMSVYGKNTESWEDTIKRDKKLYAKFIDNEDISSKANKLKLSRENIYNEKIDKKLMKKENKNNMVMQANENIRQMNLKKRDEYFDSLNMGRLENGLPPRS